MDIYNRQHGFFSLATQFIYKNQSILLGFLYILSFALFTVYFLPIFVQKETNYFSNSNMYVQYLYVLCLYLTSTYVVFFVLRFSLCLYGNCKYQKQTETVEDYNLDLVKVSVIIPAFNEGKNIRRTLKSITDTKYPKDYLEIWCIDDGSTDSTWSEIVNYRAQYSSQIHAIRLETNLGKKRALEKGFRHCTGEIVITVDADSWVDPNAFIFLVKKLQSSIDIGAVAGKVEVEKTNILWTKLYAVFFDIAFGFYRAAESQFGTVLCCPGALTAYKSNLVKLKLDQWLTSTFFSIPNNIGEDRTLTNTILEEGKFTTYEEKAICTTRIPTKYVGIVRMLLRWQRSNYREHIRGFSIIFKSSKNKARSPLGFLNLFVYGLGEFYLAALWPICLINLILHYHILSNFLVGFLLYLLLYSTLIVHPRQGWLGVKRFAIYSCVDMISFSWIYPWALITVASNKWGKKLQKKKPYQFN